MLTQGSVAPGRFGRFLADNCVKMSQKRVDEQRRRPELTPILS